MILTCEGNHTRFNIRKYEANDLRFYFFLIFQTSFFFIFYFFLLLLFLLFIKWGGGEGWEQDFEMKSPRDSGLKNGYIGFDPL